MGREFIPRPAGSVDGMGMVSVMLERKGLSISKEARA
jgi:hypothetical protein